MHNLSSNDVLDLADIDLLLNLVSESIDNLRDEIADEADFPDEVAEIQTRLDDTMSTKAKLLYIQARCRVNAMKGPQ